MGEGAVGGRGLTGEPALPEGSKPTLDENGNLVVDLPTFPTLDESATDWFEDKWTDGKDGDKVQPPTEGVVVIDGTGSADGITVTVPIPDGITDVVIKGDVTFTGDDTNLPNIIVDQNATITLDPNTNWDGDTVPATGTGTLDVGTTRPTLDGAGVNGELPNTIVITPAEGEGETITIPVTPGTTLPEDFQIVVKDPITGEAKPIAGVTIKDGFLTVVTGENRWEGDKSNDWNAPENWSGGVVPGPGSSVVIPVDEGETVTIPDGTQLGDLTVKGDGTVTIPENGNVNIDGDLTVEDDATVKVDGGTVNVEGDVIVKGDENGND